MVQEAVDSPFKVEEIYRKDEIGADTMGRISALSSPSPALAVVRKPSDSIIDDVAQLKPLLAKGGLFLALDAIRDPGNLGTILRIADWFGIDAVFVRVLWILICLFPPISSFMAVVAYILLGYIIPEETDYIDV